MGDHNMYNIIFMLMFLTFICQYSTVTSTPTHWKLHKVKQYWPLNLYYKKESNSHASNFHVPGQIVQIAPKYPVWKIHKYSGIQLKPVSSIPVLNVIHEIPQKTIKQHLPPIEDIQDILGTNSMVETVETLKELASTEDGRKMMANYIKASFPGLEISEDEIVSAINHYQSDVLKKVNQLPLNTGSTIVLKPATQSTAPQKLNVLKSSDIQLEPSKKHIPARIISSPFMFNSVGNIPPSGQHFIWIPKNHFSNGILQQTENHKQSNQEEVLIENPGYQLTEVKKEIPFLKLQDGNVVEKLQENMISNVGINSIPIVVPGEVDITNDGNDFILREPQLNSASIKDKQEVQSQSSNSDSHPQHMSSHKVFDDTKYISMHNTYVNNQEDNAIKITRDKSDKYNRPVISLKYELPNFSYTQLSETTKMSDVVSSIEHKNNVKEITRQNNYNTKPESHTNASNGKNIPNIEEYYIIPKQGDHKQFNSEAVNNFLLNHVPLKNDESRENNISTVNEKIPTKLPFSVSSNGVRFQQFEKKIITPLVESTNPEQFIQLAFSNEEKQKLHSEDSQKYNHAAFVPTKDPNKYMFALENTMLSHQKPDDIKITQNTISSNGRPVNSIIYEHPTLSYTQLSEIPLSGNNIYTTGAKTSYDVPISGFQKYDDLLPAASENNRAEVIVSNKYKVDDKSSGRNVNIEKKNQNKDYQDKISNGKETLPGTTVIYAISSNSSTMA